MNLVAILDGMTRFPDVLEALLCDLRREDARWRHDGNAWSVVEVIDHLVDEELRDFAPRLRLVLEDPSQDFDPIDPDGWVLERRGKERDLAPALAEFRELRARSIDWLRTLNEADWSAKKVHPRLGTLHAGDLLASWADHDWLHLRQLTRLRHLLVERHTGFDPTYAGGW